MCKEILTTERLLIRTWNSEDAATVFTIWGDENVMKYIAGGPSKGVESVLKGLAIGNEHFRKYGVSLWAVIELESGRLIGDCGFIGQEETPDCLELAYHFHRSAWGRGYATEAASACVKWAFSQGLTGRVVAYTHPDNSASRRVLTKVGMTEERMEDGECMFAIERSISVDT